VENDIPVLVGWTARDGDHYSVVYEVGKAKVYLMDPATPSGIRILPIEEFEAAWHDHGGPDKAAVSRWMMTVAGI
jgi:predicted double-glycine peptidase